MYQRIKLILLFWIDICMMGNYFMIGNYFIQLEWIFFAICTVVSELHNRYCECLSNLSINSSQNINSIFTITACICPLRMEPTHLKAFVSNTRITDPRTEADANKSPSLERHKHPIALSCARIILSSFLPCYNPFHHKVYTDNRMVPLYLPNVAMTGSPWKSSRAQIPFGFAYVLYFEYNVKLFSV